MVEQMEKNSLDFNKVQYMEDIKDHEKKILSTLYEQDPWVNEFMQSFYDMFGLPKTSSDCLCKNDKILFVWGMMNLVHVMSSNEHWKELKEENVEPEEAAFKFAKSYYEETGDFILPQRDLL